MAANVPGKTRSPGAEHFLTYFSSPLLRAYSRRCSMIKTMVVAASLMPSVAVWSQEVPKEQWIIAMKTTVPAFFCGPEQYFRQCFQVSAPECEETAASSTRTCLRKIEGQIPDKLVQPGDGTFWGNKIGQCAGIIYEAVLADKRISTAECNDVSNWGPQ